MAVVVLAGGRKNGGDGGGTSVPFLSCLVGLFWVAASDTLLTSGRNMASWSQDVSCILVCLEWLYYVFPSYFVAVLAGAIPSRAATFVSSLDIVLLASWPDKHRALCVLYHRFRLVRR
jgi:hypothetical protein